MTHEKLMHTEIQAGLTYRLYIEPDWFPVEGNLIASGDEELDRETEAEVRDRLKHGETWAWAAVTVEAEVDEITGEDTLCGCSYRDTAEFIQPGGYWQDMKKQALLALRRRCQQTLAKTQEQP